MKMVQSIPIIDFRRIPSSPDAVAKELLRACSEWGFFYVEHHPITKDDINDVFSLSQQFFDQANVQKSEAPYDASRNTGYKPATADRPREAFSMNKYPTSDALSSANLPPILTDCREQIWSFQRHCHALAVQLLELISLALELPPETFTSQHSFGAANFDNFELMHYPALGSIRSELSGATRYRIAPHTDWGTLTLLFMRSHNPIPGLEVRPPSYTSPKLDLDLEQWMPAAPIPGAILVNIADMLEFWSAGRLKSTWHRVVPPPPELANLGRYSIAYFLHPDKNAVLEPIKYLERDEWTPRYEGRGRTAEEHIRARIRAIYGEQDAEDEQKPVRESASGAVGVNS